MLKTRDVSAGKEKTKKNKMLIMIKFAVLKNVNTEFDQMFILVSVKKFHLKNQANKGFLKQK